MHKKFAPRMHLAKKLRASRACIHLQVEHETSPVTFNIAAWIILMFLSLQALPLTSFHTLFAL